MALDRPDVQFASKDIRRAMAQPTIDANGTLKGPPGPHSAEAVVLPATAHAFRDRWAQRCELGSMPCDTEELRLHTLDAGETPDLC